MGDVRIAANNHGMTVEEFFDQTAPEELEDVDFGNEEPTCFRTSRDILWRIVWKVDEFTKKDDLMNHTKEELAGLIIEVYDDIMNQLKYSER